MKTKALRLRFSVKIFFLINNLKKDEEKGIDKKE